MGFRFGFQRSADRDTARQANRARPVRAPAGVFLKRSEMASNAQQDPERMTQELIARAKTGDGEAFRRLTEPLQRELELHCYRLLGSLHDAQDTLQEALLAAWQGLGDFEGRASLRSWLYRIATNRCLNARRAIVRRAPLAWSVPGLTPPEPTRHGDAAWLEPYPDAPLDPAADVLLGPDARYDRRESIALAFVKGLQTLPHRQLAVLILRDVVGFPAAEVAAMLDTTVESVNSALKRARAGLKSALGDDGAQDAPPADAAATEAMVTQFVNAYEAS